MMRRSPFDAARLRLKLCGAALLLLCSACGDGIPKDQDDDDDDPAPPQAAALSILAGDATAEGTMDGTGTAARFKAPQGIAVDSSGNLYVADNGNYVIRKITPEGVVTTVAGAAGSSSFVDGSAGNARFVNPVAIAVNASGTLYVTDELRIRRITAAGQVSTVAVIPVGTDVEARSMGAVRPGAIAVDANDNLFITNSYGTRRISTGNTIMLEGQDTLNNLSGTRTFDRRGVAVDSSSNVYVFDLEREISRWNPNGLVGSAGLVALAGAQNTRGAANGIGNAAQFEQVVGLTVDPQGNVYAADAINNLVRKITPAGVVTTAAGTTRANELRTGSLPGSLADIRGIVADGKGNLYVTSGNAVVKIRLP
jgi:streptogramin lyase